MTTLLLPHQALRHLLGGLGLHHQRIVADQNGRRLRAGLGYLLLGWFLLGAPSPAWAQDPAAGTTPDSTFHLYLLMGQSNMAGRGPITPALAAVGHAQVFMLNAAGEWVPAHHPVHFDKPKVVGVGPGLSFGVAMAEADTSVKIGLVPCAVGGTSIATWQPGAYDAATDTHPYDDAVARIQNAMRAGVVKGMLWHQGEADSNPAAAATYLPKLTELIGRVRTLVGQPALPVVAGELGYFWENSPNFNAQLRRLPALVPHTAVATAENLTDKGDHTHFDGASAAELGRRYAAQMLALQRPQSAAPPRPKRAAKAKAVVK